MCIRDSCRLTGCIVDIQIPDLTVIVKIGSLDGICVVDAVSLILIVDRQVCKVGLKSPVRRAVHTCGCKCAESKLVLSCSDIFYDFLKAVEICDVSVSYTQLDVYKRQYHQRRHLYRRRRDPGDA